MQLKCVLQKSLRGESLIPINYKKEIEGRIQAKVLAEIASDVDVLYHFILPSIREQLEQESTDEPELTKKHIQDYSENITSAKVVKIVNETYHETSEIYGTKPAALMVGEIIYNESIVSHFRTIWVLDRGVWYSTALYKIW